MKIQVQKIKGFAVSFIIGLFTMFLLMVFFGGNNVSKEMHTPSQVEKHYYTCSMHPQVKLPEKGQCPICFMDLIPLDHGADSDGNSEALLIMTDTAKKLAQIQTQPVVRKYVAQKIRMVGKVEYDETKVSSITSWVEGRIDRLFVDYTGILIKKGDHMVRFYSSQLLSAQEEYLQALQSMENLSDDDMDVIKETAKNTLVSTREKLKLLGINKKQIKELEERGTASDFMTIYAPVGGIVVSKNVTEGAYVKTGTVIYTIANLSKVWLKLDAYEADISRLKYGQKVVFETESYPGEKFEGIISFIDPVLNNKTRTIKVRVNVDNTEGKLKPGMLVRATVSVTLTAKGVACDKRLIGKWICPMHPEIVKDEKGYCDICQMDLQGAEELGYVSVSKSKQPAPLVIPVTAPLITGKRAVVYVQLLDRNEPVFEGREIVLGVRAGDYYIVKSGLAEGEMVVVNGNFKIDSALQIQAKPSMMSSMKKKSSVEESRVDDYSLFAVSLSDLYEAYFSLSTALAADDFEKASDSLTILENSLKSVDISLLRDQSQGEKWKDISKAITVSLAHKSHIKNIADIRTMILEDLSEAVIDLSKSFGSPEAKHFEMHCPMAKGGKGASWLQDEKILNNPYYGKSMLRCGVVKNILGDRE